MSPKPVHTTSARKAGRQPGTPFNPALIALVVVLAAAVLAIMLSSSSEDEREEPVPTPIAAPTTLPATPTPQPTTASYTFFDDAFETTPTPSPSSEGEVDSQTGNEDQACIAFHWTAGLQPGKEVPTELQVTVDNNCSNDLASITLSFEARGFRGGEQIEVAQGSMGGSLAAGETRQMVITLPAVPGGYDRVDLQPVE